MRSDVIFRARPRAIFDEALAIGGEHLNGLGNGGANVANMKDQSEQDNAQAQPPSWPSGSEGKTVGWSAWLARREFGTNEITVCGPPKNELPDFSDAGRGIEMSVSNL